MKAMPFSVLGRKALAGLAGAMEEVLEGAEHVERRALEAQGEICDIWTWDNAATLVADALLEVQP